MADPEELLGALPEESPPPEIVIAAVRVFRYRVLAVAALAVALTVVGVVWANKLAGNGRFLAEVGDARYTGGVLQDADGVGEMETVGGITLTVWEVVRSADGRTIYVHVLGWDDRGRDAILDMRDPRFGGIPANELGLEGNPGGTEEMTFLDLWFAVERRSPGPLTFEALVEVSRPTGWEAVARVPFEIAMEEGLP